MCCYLRSSVFPRDVLFRWILSTATSGLPDFLGLSWLLRLVAGWYFPFIDFLDSWSAGNGRHFCFPNHAVQIYWLPSTTEGNPRGWRIRVISPCAYSLISLCSNPEWGQCIFIKSHRSFCNWFTTYSHCFQRYFYLISVSHSPVISLCAYYLISLCSNPPWVQCILIKSHNSFSLEVIYHWFSLFSDMVCVPCSVSGYQFAF